MEIRPDIKVIQLDVQPDAQVMIGHAGFIKTVEDLYEAVASAAPGIKFGVAFVEASGKRLIRSEGNDVGMQNVAEKNAAAINAGHTFIIAFKGAFPININNAIKSVPEVVSIFCSTANAIQVVVAETAQGRSVLGIIDGLSGLGLEFEADRAERRKLVRDLGYKV